MRLGFLGLGKMGSRMAGKLIRAGHEVIVWNRSKEAVEAFKKEHPQAKSALSIEELVQSLVSPRILWSMVPAGSPTEEIVQQLSDLIAPGDIVIDGGNSFYKDTQRRFEEFKKKGIKFLGIGVSGGIIAATDGYPLMAGGEKSAYEYVVPILDSLTSPKGGHAYVGEGGAGHFVKMVHNGIEYGIMQSLSEGFDVLNNSPYNLDLVSIAKLYQKNTLVSGFMLDRVVEALQKDPGLKDVIGEIDATGEAEWTITQAKEEGVDVPSIELALEYRKKSKTDEKIKNSFTAKMIAALRNAFGGHEVKKK